MSKFSLRSNPSFFQSAQRITSPVGVLYIHDSQETTGFAVVTPKKSFRRAVDRHTAKRKVKAILRLLVRPGQHIVVVANPKVLITPHLELKTMLYRALDHV